MFKRLAQITAIISQQMKLCITFLLYIVTSRNEEKYTHHHSSVHSVCLQRWRSLIHFHVSQKTAHSRKDNIFNIFHSTAPKPLRETNKWILGNQTSDSGVTVQTGEVLQVFRNNLDNFTLLSSLPLDCSFPIFPSWHLLTQAQVWLR